MTAVDHAELKRLAEGAADGLHGGRASPRVMLELLTAGWERQVPRATGAPTMADAEYIVAACRDLPALLSEIEGLKKTLEIATDNACEYFNRAIEAERQLAALRTQAPDSWRPIETAPKDGTRILLSGMPYGPKVDVGAWGSTTYNRSAKAYNRGWTTCPGNETNPTHWMPLPAAPVTRVSTNSDFSPPQ